jgi:hypothetical protein
MYVLGLTRLSGAGWFYPSSKTLFFSDPKVNVLYTGLDAKEVDYIITNSSLFNPDPALTSMVAAHFKMRPDIEEFNLAGDLPPPSPPPPPTHPLGTLQKPFSG